MRLWFRRPKTEVELIEDTRKAVRVSKWFSIIKLCLAAIFLGWLLPKFLMILLDLMRYIPESEKHEEWAGFVVGIMFGFLFMLIAFQGIFMGFEALQNLVGRRKDLLLLKYHDALVKLAEDNTSNNRLEATGETPAPQP